MISVTKKEISSFNNPNTLLVISTYPKQSSLHSGGGLASYTKYTIQSILKANPHQKVVVFANILDKQEFYLENNVLVIRCWKRNSPLLIPQVLSWLFKFNRSKNLLIEFEFAAYGDIIPTFFIGILICSLKFFGKHTTTVVHQVVNNLEDLAIHTGLNRSPRQIKTYGRFLRLFYKLIFFGSNHVITLEKKLANRFNQITDGNKAVSIPHGLFPQKRYKKIFAKKKLGLNPKDYHIIAFGYLSHYKGSDILVNAFQKKLTIKGREVKLILAGGESPTQGQKIHYHEFYDRLHKKILNNPNIISTGFVPDTLVKTYFSASDLAILPYRTFMSASGPLALAIAYNRPFIASKKLSNYTDFTFNNNHVAIRNLIRKVLSNRDLYKIIAIHSRGMRGERDFNNQGKLYLDIVKES